MEMWTLVLLLFIGGHDPVVTGLEFESHALCYQAKVAWDNEMGQKRANLGQDVTMEWTSICMKVSEKDD